MTFLQRPQQLVDSAFSSAAWASTVIISDSMLRILCLKPPLAIRQRPTFSAPATTIVTIAAAAAAANTTTTFVPITAAKQRRGNM